MSAANNDGDRDEAPRRRQDNSELDLLISRVEAWYQDLLLARDQVELLMAHPAARAFLDQPSPGSRRKSTGQPLASLDDCRTQTDVAEYLARTNGGIADLNAAARIIMRIGMATSTNERSIRKNLGTRLKETGRWERMEDSQYWLKDWRPPENGAQPGDDQAPEPAGSLNRAPEETPG